MENIIKRLLLIGIMLLITWMYLFSWIHCPFDTRFYFSPLDVKLQIIFDIRGDTQLSVALAHILHNKVTQGSIDIFNSYFYFFDISFLAMLLSPLTIFGVLLRIYYLIKKENFLWYEVFAAILILFLPIPMLFGFINKEKFFFVFCIFAIGLVLLAIRGVLIFVAKQKYGGYPLLGVAIFSLWYLLLLPTAMQHFCH